MYNFKKTLWLNYRILLSFFAKLNDLHGRCWKIFVLLRLSLFQKSYKNVTIYIIKMFTTVKSNATAIKQQVKECAESIKNLFIKLCCKSFPPFLYAGTNWILQRYSSTNGKKVGICSLLASLEFGSHVKKPVNNRSRSSCNFQGPRHNEPMASLLLEERLDNTYHLDDHFDC